MKKPYKTLPLSIGAGFSSFNHPHLVACFVLAAALVCLYSVSLGHNFLFDEETIIMNNPLIRQINLIPKLFQSGYFYHEEEMGGKWLQYYRPFTSMTFAADFFFWKLNPLGYNLTNLLLHIGVCLLLYRLLLRMVGNTLAAFLAVLLYGVHTVHTETVTYIASRGDLLGAILLLAGLAFYWKGRLGAAFLVFVLALLSKESSVLFPAYLVLLDRAFIRTPWRKLLIRTAVFAGVSALYWIDRNFFCPVPLGPPVTDWGSSWLRMLSMGRPLLNYFQALLYPEPFKFCDQIIFAKRFTSRPVLETLVLGSLLSGAWFLSWRSRGPVFFGLGLFLVSLLPYSQGIHFFPEWAEHYLYIPAMGLTVLLGVGIKNFLERGSSANARFRRVIFMVSYAGVFLFLCARTTERNSYYNDSERYYWRLAQSPTPYAHFGYLSLGRIAMDHGELDKAGVYFKTALAIEPNSEPNIYNIGFYYMKKKRYEEAYQYFKKAYETGLHAPGALNNACVALVHLRRYADAVRGFEEVQRKDPKKLNVYINLLLTFELLGQPEKGMAWAEKGLGLMGERDLDAAILTTAMVTTAYRQGWDDRVRAKLDVLSREHSKVMWYGEVARLLTGKIAVEEYEKIIHAQYKGFENAAQYYVLMAYVLQNRKDLARGFVQKNRANLENPANKDAAFIKKELGRAGTL